MRRPILTIVACRCLPLMLGGCAAALLRGAAAGGYVAHKEGYRVQNPITKAEDSESKER